ncbi:nuclease harbi1-like protein [Elysia marginata]|uniref:Nuclease harbi1-like protein n=1 Tax=Elysia marginata TaxID=1093978 RepID=A0AAV4JKN2_9GAST|nr:nuclease harbi1-like protein [Elysia marginata]
MPPPDREKRMNIATEFYTRFNFPLCLGAIEGKHIRIEKPASSLSLYYNYKGFFSIILLTVTGSEGKFVVVDVGWCGSNNDGGVFQKSAFGRSLASGTLNLPTEGTVPQTDIKLQLSLLQTMLSH